MIIKPVNRPVQDEFTKSEDVQYPNERWCVNTHMFAEIDGGMELWFKHLETMEAKGANVTYLYEIKAVNERIVNGENEDDWFETIIYFIRADYKSMEL